MLSTSNSWKPHGLAIKDFYQGKSAAAINILMDDGSITKMPIEIYFRSEKELPELEKIALKLCRGKVLDVGAGAGAHSLILQTKGLDVTALDIDPSGIEVAANLGVHNTICADFLNFDGQFQYDTLLFLMNGIGLAANLQGLRDYLQKANELTTPSGQIILDSSDLRNGEVELDFSQDYFGIFDYQLEYQGVIGEKYQWIYIDQDLLIQVASNCGWKTNIIYEQEDGSYLAQLKKK